MSSPRRTTRPIFAIVFQTDPILQISLQTPFYKFPNVFSYIYPQDSTWTRLCQLDFRHENVRRKEKEKLHCFEKHHAVASGYQNVNTFHHIVVFKFHIDAWSHQKHDKFSVDSVNEAAIFITLQLCFRLLLLVKTLKKLEAEEENTEEFNRRHDHFNSTFRDTPSSQSPLSKQPINAFPSPLTQQNIYTTQLFILSSP